MRADPSLASYPKPSFHHIDSMAPMTRFKGGVDESEIAVFQPQYPVLIALDLPDERGGSVPDESLVKGKNLPDVLGGMAFKTLLREVAGIGYKIGFMLFFHQRSYLLYT